MTNQKFKIIDCSKNCRMTKELRNSSFCNKEAKLIDGKLSYGCHENMSSLSAEEKQLYDCDTWDMGIMEACNTCPLACINNKNPKMAVVKKQKEKIESIVGSINPSIPTFGIDAGTIEQISKTYAESNDEAMMDYGEEALESAKLAQQFFSSAMKGRHVDLAFFKRASKDRADRLRRLEKRRKQKTVAPKPIKKD